MPVLSPGLPVAAEPRADGHRRRHPHGEGWRLRDELLAAAEALLIEAGDQQAVSIRAVAKRVGVTPTAIYLHFASKDELVFAVCEQHLLEFDRVQQEESHRASDPVEALRRRGRAYVSYGLEHPELYRILFMNRPTAVPDSWTAQGIMDSPPFVHLVEDVQAGLDAGAIRPGDAATIAFDLWSAVHGITSILLTHREFPWRDLEPLVDHLLDVQVRGVRSSPA